MNPPAAVTFDFWGTLFADVGDVMRVRNDVRINAFSEATGVAREKVAEAHKNANRAFLKHHIEKQQTLNTRDAFEMMCVECEVEFSKDDADAMVELFATAIFHGPPTPIAGAIEAVRATADRVPIAIISDAGMSPGSSLRVLLENAGILDAFTVTVFSNEVGVAKPQRPMFETAAEGLGVGIHELLHIGDLEPTDIDGALAVGSQAALFTGHQDKYLEGTRAHHHFPTWADYREKLSSLLG